MHSEALPLFVTRFGLSDRTAIGVQTKFILAGFEKYRHVYWNESIFEHGYPGSSCIESVPFARVPALKRRGPVRDALLRLGLSWWRDGHPTPALVRRLQDIARTTSAVYLAPLEPQDSRRMRAIVDVMERPFVVHLWDLLGGDADADTRWLIKNARHFFALNEAMLAPFDARGSSLLPFTRSVPPEVASWKDDGVIRIAIMGDIGVYREGVVCLIEAVDQLATRGIAFKVEYFGPARNLERYGFDRYQFIHPVGFISSFEEKDRRVAQCTVGYLPGPSADPETDPRSRFSIPSRVLDFVATGLPLVGYLHPGSATFDMCSRSGLGPDLVKCGPGELADRLANLRTKAAWQASADASLDAFRRVRDAFDLTRLRKELSAA